MSTNAKTGAASTSVSADGEPESVLELKHEVEQLREALWAHATVDQAIGVVIALCRLSPDEAWDAIRNVSMRTNTKVRDIAHQIIVFASTGELAPDVRREMERQVRQLRRVARPIGRP